MLLPLFLIIPEMNKEIHNTAGLAQLRAENTTILKQEMMKAEQETRKRSRLRAERERANNVSGNKINPLIHVQKVIVWIQCPRFVYQRTILQSQRKLAEPMTQ